MLLHQVIFAKKDLKIAQNSQIPQQDEKIALVRKWQDGIISGRYIKSKEEGIRPLFLHTFFTEILGYKADTANVWQLSTEDKTKIDGSKADAALGYFSMGMDKTIDKDVRVVIEIKDARTTLDKPQNRKDFKGSAVEQAFLYAVKNGDACKWVIVSNFLEIRLYLAADMTKYELFDIMTLHIPENFKRFYFLLSCDKLFFKRPPSQVDTLLAERIATQKNISQAFYTAYSQNREILFYHLKNHNPTIPVLSLLSFAQTILDRMIFISVVKDYGLLDPKILTDVNEIAKKSWADDNQEIWRQLIKLFSALNTGHSRVQKFNGGLFATNKSIEALIIKDVCLRKLIVFLNEYDFESQLNINILGHIFEQSITDLADLRQNLSNLTTVHYIETVDDITIDNFINNTSKRKKDGVFYTPSFISSFLIKNTISIWLEKAKKAIGIDKLSEFPDTESERKYHIELWTKYADKLSTIKVLDPACGSGAFLTQAFDYLLSEWLIVFDIIEKLENSAIEVVEYDLLANISSEKDKKIAQYKKHIVESNLFGVDINTESIEITKLGLWIKTATNQNALASLDKNIKCGNSIIEDKTISTNAFIWSEEFCDVLKEGGFDIIIGNPPYIFSRELITDEEKNYLKKSYTLTQFKLNTYILFIEQAYKLLSKEGSLGFIIPNNWLTVATNSDFRHFILTQTYNIQIINNQDKIFQDANVDTLLLIFDKTGDAVLSSYELKNTEAILISDNSVQIYLEQESYIINYRTDINDSKLLAIINKCSLKLSAVAVVNNGVQAYTVGEGIPKQTKEIRDNRLYHSLKQHDSTWLKYLDGVDVQRYFIGWSGQFIKYGKNLSRCRKEELFKNPRILVRQIPAPVQSPYAILASYTTMPLINDNNSMIITALNTDYDLRYILAAINSKLTTYWFNKTFSKTQRKLFPQFKVNELLQFPIYPLNMQQQQQFFIDVVEKIIANQQHIANTNNLFKQALLIDFSTINFNQKLQSWAMLSFQEFALELKKQKILIPKNMLQTWISFFEAEKQNIEKQKIQNEQYSQAIDFEFYKLYNLSLTEIKLIG